MHWAEGDFWRTSIETSLLDKQFEYKYIVQSNDKNNVEKWEGGDNRKLDLSAIESSLNDPKNSGMLKKLEKYKFKIGTQNLVYIRKKEYLIIIDNWQP